MRNLFRGYYRPTKEEFDDLWSDCIFSFDTNILLNVYRYTSKTRERFFDILDKLQERIWLPHQVAYEYQEERLDVISQQLKPYGELQESLDNHLEKLQEILEKYSKRHSFSDFVDIKQVLETIKRAYKKVKKILAESNSNYPNLFNQDDFREKLTDLFEGKVGQSYSEEDLVKFYKEAEKRFKNNCPPGYMDSRGNKKEPPECYGDVVIWFQLLDYAKEQKKPLIFVTDDQKEDWWLKSRGKTIGPRPELIQEMFAEANVSFYLYTGESFLERAGSFLSLSSEPEVIEEARKIGLQDNERLRLIDKSDLLRQAERLRLFDRSDLLRQAEQLQSIINTSDLLRQTEGLRFFDSSDLLKQFDRSDLLRQAEQLQSIINTSDLLRQAERLRLFDSPDLLRQDKRFQSISGPPEDISKNVGNQSLSNREKHNYEKEANEFTDQLSDEQSEE